MKGNCLVLCVIVIIVQQSSCGALLEVFLPYRNAAWLHTSIIVIILIIVITVIILLIVIKIIIIP